jgi:REP-associated tyrosine transposase
MMIPGNAEPQLGSTHRGWYSRGYLPHCDHPGLLQAITYRLADSLPAAILEQMEAELRSLPPERQDSERRRRVEAWLDAGHGSCVLGFPGATACAVDTWRRFAGERYDLIAWVVMPNHVHVLIRTYEGVALGKIVQSWKSYTGRQIREMVEENSRAGDQGSQEGRAGARPSWECRAPARQPEGLWMREYWDRHIRDEPHFQAVVDYIHKNSVKAGLVGRAEGWPWTSAREYAAAIEELITLAQEMREADRRGEDLGLSEEEIAFYDALEVNDSAVKVLGDQTLQAIAQELVRTVRNNVTIDWTLRENVRAKMRVTVKRTLRRYGYPPDEQERATQTVLEQAEVLCRDWAVA